MVHPGVQRGLLVGLDLWISARSLAVWIGGRNMVAGRGAALVAGRKVVLIALGLLPGWLGILPVEPAKRLAGADLAAGKSHGFKGSLVAEFRLHVRLLGRRRAGARIFRFVVCVLFGHKAQPTRGSPQSRYFFTQSTTNLVPLLLAFVMTAKKLLSRLRPQGAEETSDVFRQKFWLFGGGEVAAARHFSPALKVISPLDPGAGGKGRLLGKVCHRAGHAHTFAFLELQRPLLRLIIKPAG